MKIFNVQQIRDWDAYTIENEPIASVDLMERASQTLCDWFIENHSQDCPIKIFCGIGNNGGDGLAIARILHLNNYHVKVFICEFSKKYSEDFSKNLTHLEELKFGDIQFLSEKELPQIPENEIIIDAIFGSGLNRPITGIWAEIINQINDSGSKIISVDVPSGLFADKFSEGAIIKAHQTFTFQAPKLAFLFPENQNFVGELIIKNIRLSLEYQENTKSKFFYLTKKIAKSILKSRQKFSHKGTFGHAILFAGSYGMAGTAILSAKACLRSGAGLVTIHAPKSAYQILQISFPEAMVEIDEHEFVFSRIKGLEKFKAIGVGPGLGTNELTVNALTELIEQANIPMVLDADALNIISKNKTLLKKLPENSILTPHPKEFERLFGHTKNSFDRLSLLKNKAKEFKVFIILKGANTAITCPDGHVYFNSTGNPGMATAGSGDVLTGIITGLLAQNYIPKNAAILGTYLHGLAGDLAANELQQESLLAGDLIDFFGKAIKNLRQ